MIIKIIITTEIMIAGKIIISLEAMVARWRGQ
jgi:hypothetical protein